MQFNSSLNKQESILALKQVTKEQKVQELSLSVTRMSPNDVCVGERSRKQKKFVHTKQDPKIIQERWHTRFRPLLTNDCSGRRVDEAGGSRSRNASHDPSHDLSLKRIPRADLRGRRRSSSKKDQCYDPSTGIHTSHS